MRALRGRDLWQGAQQKAEKLILGNRGANWCLCPEALSQNSVIYSFGVGEDISFDLQLIERFGSRVHAFDPTPRSIQWVRLQHLPKEFVFHPYGLADFDGVCEFLPPENPAHISHTMLSRPGSGPPIEAPVYRLATVMKMLKHAQVDLLKMDIEGAEYAALSDMLACGVHPRQILVEFHHRWPQVGIGKTGEAIQRLNSVGYRIFDVSPSGDEYGFKLSG